MLRGQYSTTPNIASVGIVYTKYYGLLAGHYILPGDLNIKALGRRCFARGWQSRSREERPAVRNFQIRTIPQNARCRVP
jgi:hypothetical protein